MDWPECPNIQFFNKFLIVIVLCLHFRFQCMKTIADDGADLMTLDPGQGYFAGRYHNMMPLVSENYENGKYQTRPFRS